MSIKSRIMTVPPDRCLAVRQHCRGFEFSQYLRVDMDWLVKTRAAVDHVVIHGGTAHLRMPLA